MPDHERSRKLIAADTATSLALCPICRGNRFEVFSGRPAARCTVCGALERHRALVRATGEVLLDPPRRGRVLEAGPLSRWVYGRFLTKAGWRYTSIDRWRSGNPRDPREVGFVDHEADLADLLRFRSGSFDLFITQHVIEEIPDYERALSEIARLLRPAGIALLEIPYDPSLPVSAMLDPPDRYGNVWRFGADVVERVRDHFAAVEIIGLIEGSYSGRLLSCRMGAPDR